MTLRELPSVDEVVPGSHSTLIALAQALIVDEMRRVIARMRPRFRRAGARDRFDWRRGRVRDAIWGACST